MRFDAGLLHEHARVRREARERERDLAVELDHLADRPRLLELGDGLALHAERDAARARDADRRGALLDRLEGVVDLEELAVRREDGDRAVVLGAHGGAGGAGAETRCCRPRRAAVRCGLTRALIVRRKLARDRRERVGGEG